jgi:hypothetical protein
MASNPTHDDIQTLLVEERMLAEKSGDEYEQRRAEINEAASFLTSRAPVRALWVARGGGFLTAAEAVARLRARMLSAVDYFEIREDWEPFTDAILCYVHTSRLLAAYDDARVALQRALAKPALSAWSRGLALDELANEELLERGYASQLTIARNALKDWTPGQPMLHLTGIVAILADAAWQTGQWSETDYLLPLVLALWEQAQYSPKVINQLGPFIGTLFMARGREQWDMIDALTPALNAFLSLEWRSADRALVAAYVQDDPALLDLTCYRCGRPIVIRATLDFLSERGLCAPAALLDGARSLSSQLAPGSRYAYLAQSLQTATALTSDDDQQLADAIAAAEARDLRPHAARLRIVLAQRTRDRAELERAHVALTLIGDRQFLRRLEEAQGTFR